MAVRIIHVGDPCANIIRPDDSEQFIRTLKYAKHDFPLQE
jgi:hypothetical protein